MSDPEMKPIVIEPEPLPKMGNPDHNTWVLYDEDFPVEHRLQYTLKDSRQRLRTPHFSTSEVARWVFARDTNWMRYVFNVPRTGLLELPHIGILEFRRLAKGRTSSDGGGERRLTLPDCERLAHALYRRGDIDGIALQLAVETVFSVARAYQDKRKRRL